MYVEHFQFRLQFLTIHVAQQSFVARKEGNFCSPNSIRGTDFGPHFTVVAHFL